jgi:hypothetical protein
MLVFFIYAGYPAPYSFQAGYYNTEAECQAELPEVKRNFQRAFRPQDVYVSVLCLEQGEVTDENNEDIYT